MEYQSFVNQKQFTVSESGFDIDRESLNPMNFEFQKDCTQFAVKKGNAALWEECGLGKTIQQLEYADIMAKAEKRPSLICAPLAVAQQTRREGEKFGFDVNICKEHSDIIPGINITNYDRVHKFDFSQFGALILDESSILRNYMGKTKRLLVEAGNFVKYKLSCTATPSPNDHMELLNQAEFLGVMKSSMALAIWFINKTNELGGYRLKKHAEDSFWQWVSSWAVYLSAPSDLGYENNGFNLPPLNVHEHEIPISEFDLKSGNGSFLREVSLNATSYNREKKHTLIPRCDKTIQLLHDNPHKQFIVWIERNDEGDYLKKRLPNAVEIRGSESTDKKEQAAIDFVKGNIQILISKPSIFGYGLNFQNCADAIFCGLSFSYENYYQAVRRLWRFGQLKPVNIHIVYGSSEKGILQVVRRKEEQHKELKAAMFGRLKDIQSQNFNQKAIKTEYKYNGAMFLPNWIH